ncbi:hypothetical protein [Sphingopyxis sp.]|uniref:hypothetical protein n=1 Tax=Sphingopyxis sp. TaxID=1908224 RepID=UPI003BA9D3FB
MFKWIRQRILGAQLELWESEVMQPILDKIADTLADGSLNYGVFLQFFELKLDCAGTSSNLIEKAFGSGAIVGGIQEVEPFAVWPEIQQCIFFDQGPRLVAPVPLNR